MPPRTAKSARALYAEGYAEGFGDGYHKGTEDAERGLFAPPGTRKRGNPHSPRVPGSKFYPGQPKKKRRKTAYQSAYSAAYKRLKKKHPRMSFGSLSKKAHAAARKKRK